MKWGNPPPVYDIQDCESCSARWSCLWGLVHEWPGAEYVKEIHLMTTKVAVKSAIQMCEECQSIDPAPNYWEKRKLEVNRNWHRLGMYIMHYGACYVLTLTNCDPSHFSIWNQLVRQDLVSVIRQLEAVFFEQSPSHKLLTDNDTGFCSREFRIFVNEWGINLWFCCTYTPARNGIAKWCHRMVK